MDGVVLDGYVQGYELTVDNKTGPVNVVSVDVGWTKIEGGILTVELLGDTFECRVSDSAGQVLMERNVRMGADHSAVLEALQEMLDELRNHPTTMVDNSRRNDPVDYTPEMQAASSSIFSLTHERLQPDEHVCIHTSTRLVDHNDRFFIKPIDDRGPAGIYERAKVLAVESDPAKGWTYILDCKGYPYVQVGIGWDAHPSVIGWGVYVRNGGS